MKRVLLFLSQGFEAYEASVFTDVIGWSRAFGTEAVDMVTTALRPEIQCTWNLIVRPELEFDKVKISDFDALAIPGGFEKAVLQDCPAGSSAFYLGQRRQRLQCRYGFPHTGW